MYPSDFNAAESVYAPVEDTLFLGLPPLLAALLVLLILAVAAGAYMMGQRRLGQSGGSDADKAPAEIYEVILRYASAARAASSNELKQKAEVLDRKIEEYLGPVIVVGKELGGLVKALKQAGEGKIDEPAKPEPRHDHEPGHKSCACGGAGTPRGCTCGGGHGHPATAQPVSINQIYIGGTPVAHSSGHDHAAHEAEPPKGDKPEAKSEPKTVKRDLSHREQVEALDKAVRALNDYWLDRDKRIAELKAAQAALNRRPPSSELPSSTTPRVWNR